MPPGDPPQRPQQGPYQGQPREVRYPSGPHAPPGGGFHEGVGYRAPSQAIPRPDRRQTPPAHPIRQGASASYTPAPGTDPTMYSWDRLSTEQQEAVLRAVSRARVGRRGRTMRAIIIGIALVVVLAALVYVGLFVLHAGLLIGIPT